VHTEHTKLFACLLQIWLEERDKEKGRASVLKEIEGRQHLAQALPSSFSQEVMPPSQLCTVHLWQRGHGQVYILRNIRKAGKGRGGGSRRGVSNQ
jgi:hypothetical protein